MLEMATIEDKMSAGKQGARVRSSVGADKRQLKVLCEQLLRAQPQSEPLLKRLLARSQGLGSHRAFAPIHDGRCSGCNMTVAIARLQKVKAGEFINCANCMKFLYYDPR